MAVVEHEPRSAPRPAVLPRPQAAARPQVVTRAETAECTCPDACERDHERD
ncbi:hypothetical protein Gocc_1306 [Gaiella occulta]|uniref:Uncharacterized protein n=1 Tax=Gaiella occulta TaxID=1002870 RepID=A0A7M2Z054_9ACTN|nr:hypothetical protein [Gaiella occulta]RDI75508.1 hypothetical protein Gocc_1306 [Gaiella occulta]